MNIDYSKIETVDKLAERYFKQNPSEENTILFKNDWSADYSIRVKKFNKINYSKDNDRDYNLKTTVDCSLHISNMLNIAQTDINSKNIDFTIGDIINEFLNIFTPINYDGFLDFDVNIDLLNSFIKKYSYPPVSVEKETRESNIIDNIAINKNGIKIIQSSSGLKKETVKINPFNDQIKNYVDAFKKIYYKVYCIHYGHGNLIFDVTFIHSYNFTKDQFLHDRLIHQGTINSIVLYDASNALGRYKFIKCPSCNKYFFQNRKQKYCNSCKPLSLMTKAEIEERQINSDMLSNNYDRLAYLRKLNRIEPKLSDKEKNKLLIESGFKPLQKKKKR